MKKFIDRYLFSRTGLQVAFSVIAILLFSLLATSVKSNVTRSEDGDFYNKLFWGFRQITDGGSVSGTLEELDVVASENGKSSAPIVLGITLFSWLVGLILYSFVTGAVVNAFDGRKDKIESGAVRYKFKGHGIVLGWDFQGVGAVKALLAQWKLKEVLIVSSIAAEEIRSELEKLFDSKELDQIFIYNSSIGVEDNLEMIQAELAKIVIILGDQNDDNNDAGNMRTAEILMRNIIAPYYKKHPLPKQPIKIFIDIARQENLKLWGAFPTLGKNYDGMLDVHIVNFFNDAAYQLFSSFSRIQNYHTENEGYTATYYPLEFRNNSEASHCHAFISGMNEMAHALVLRLVTILPAGKQINRITICSTDEDALELFKNAYPFNQLLGVEVDFLAEDICTGEKARNELIDAVRDSSASVSVFITDDCPDAALATLNRMPREVRFENVHFLIEQRTFKNQLPVFATPYKLAGFPRLTYFGMLDCFLSSIEHTMELEEALFADKSFSLERQKFFVRDFSNSLLEKINAMGCQFEFDCPDVKCAELEQIPEQSIDAIMQSEHIRNVNFKLLNDVRFADRTDEGLNVSSELVPWKDAAPSLKEEYARRLALLIPSVKMVFGNGEFPYKIVPKGFRKVLGLIGVFSGSAYEEHDALRNSLRNTLLAPLQKESCLYSSFLPGKAKTPSSVAILLIPDDYLAYDLFRASFDRYPFAIIAVLPCVPDEYEKHYATQDAKERFRQFMRCVHSCHVLAGATHEEMENFIRSRSDQLLVANAETNANVVADKWSNGDYACLATRVVTKTFVLNQENKEWKITTV